jgi:hypothetical protein
MSKKTRATKATQKKSDKSNWRDRFLELFAVSLNVAQAAQGAGINRKTVYKEREKSPDFAAQMDDAREAAIERLEAVAYERARTQSDVLLIFLLKSHKPERYRETHEQQHSGEVTITVKRETKPAKAN